MDLKKIKNTFGERFKENEPLSNWTTFRIGGPAKYFLITESSSELKSAIKIVYKADKLFNVIGNGSNLLVSDQGYRGMIIKIRNPKYEIRKEKIWFESGVPLSQAVKSTVEQGFQGLEKLVGIPGTIGGAIYGNAGAYGQEIANMVSWVEVLDNHGQLKKYRKDQCQFGYRESIFKHNKEIIVRIGLKLKSVDQDEFQLVMQEILKLRTQKNYALGKPSAGSVFKNLFLKKLPQKLIKQLELEKVTIGGKVGAGYLVDQAGLKGKQIGQAQVSPNHANFIINLGGATAEQVVMLISYIKQQVRDQFGVQLQEEIQYLGF